MILSLLNSNAKGIWNVKQNSNALKMALSQHYASVHNQIRRFYCYFSEKFFAQYDDFGKHSLHIHTIPKWRSAHYTTREYDEQVDIFEPRFILKEVKKGETMKRKALAGVGGSGKRVKKVKVDEVVLQLDLNRCLLWGMW